VTDLDDGQRVTYVCTDGTLAPVDQADLMPDGLPDPDDDRAQIVLVNRCTDTVTLTLKTDKAIRWPLFELFD
jgi:hypothetical protein